MVVSYHVAQTYQNPAAEEREAFYNTGLATPYVIFDGSEVVWEPQIPNYKSRYEQAFTVVRTVTPLFNISVLNANASSGVGSIELRIVASVDTVIEGEVSVFIAVLEDSLLGAYTTFVNVCQQLLEFPIEIAYPDSMDTTVTFSHNVPTDKMKAAIFIQNMDTKDIYQTTYGYFQGGSK